MNSSHTLVRGRDARAALPPPVLTLAAGRHHTAETIFRAWFESKSPHTIEAYKHDLDDFSLFFSRALNISPALTREVAFERFVRQSAPSAHETALYFRAHLEQCGLSPSSINRHLSTLRSVVKLSRQLGYCTWMLETQGVKAEKRRDTAGPTIEQVQELLTHTADDTEAQTRDFAIVVVFVCTGLRVGELCGLDWDTTDLQRGVAWVRGKMRREKELIELAPQAVEAIERYARYRGTASGPLFHSLGNRGKARNRRLETRSVNRIVRLLGQAIGIRLWPHGLRHLSLTLALKESAKIGLSIHDVLAHSRHKGIATLQNYLDRHNEAETKKRISRLVGDALSRQQNV